MFVNANIQNHEPNQYCINEYLPDGGFMTLVDLRIEHQTQPLGLNTLAPRFSWKFVEAPDNFQQEKYRIQVSPRIDYMDVLWDSGVVTSNESQLVPYYGPLLKEKTRDLVRAKAAGNGVWTEGSSASWFETAPAPGTWAPPFITPDPINDPGPSLPMALRKQFEIPFTPGKAKLRTTAMGLYEISLNGVRTGDALLPPGWTAYKSRLAYQTFDVSHLLERGHNTIQGLLGPDWDKGEITWFKSSMLYGKHMELAMELEIFGNEGQYLRISTDDSWEAPESPLLFADIYHGEKYDARLEGKEHWRPVQALETPAAKLVPQDGPPVRRQAHLPARLLAANDSDPVFDFGQVLTGWVRFTVSSEEGERLVIRHAETLDSRGHFYTDNLRGARNRIEYTLKGGGPESFEPRFSFQGFRYIQLDDWPGRARGELPNAADFEAIGIHLDMGNRRRQSMRRELTQSILAAPIQSGIGRHVLAFALCTGLFIPAAGALQIDRQTVNGRINPLGIGAGDISLSWAASSDKRNVIQRAYHLKIGTKEGANDIWDSGKVDSDRQIDIVLPKDITLESSTRYFWTVKLWDNTGATSDWSQTAWFETGLLHAQDWDTAQWIGGKGNEEWNDYIARFNFAILDTAMGILLRASPDGRNAYMFQINCEGATPVLCIHEKRDGGYSVVENVDLARFSFTNEVLKSRKHSIEFDLDGERITSSLDGKIIDSRSMSRYICGTIGLRSYGKESAKVYSIKVVDKKSKNILLDADFKRDSNIFSTGSIVRNTLQVKDYMDTVYRPAGAPLLRSTISIKKDLQSARLYATAHGIYQVSINGKKAGDQYYAPGWTNYNKRLQTQTYDITALLNKGENAIGVVLGDGWYRGKVGIGWKEVYGNTVSFISKIRVQYRDGSTEEFTSNEQWRTMPSPRTMGDLQDGERYDAQLEIAGWDTIACPIYKWSPVSIVGNSMDRFVPQPDEPVREIAVVPAVSRSNPTKDSWVYDLGQNMVGVARVTIRGKKGQTVTIRHAEDIYRTGNKKGRMYTDNLRGAQATDKYTFARNETVRYQPLFTQHGFRYVEVSGVDTPPEVQDVQGVVLGSDLPDIGDLRLSNPMLNKLVQNIRWGQRGNFLSIPTDTPARDERLGWTGDINVFAPTASRYQDTRAFLGKWMDDIRDNQKHDGNIAAIVPQPGWQFDGTGVGWSDAVITVPYAVWRSSGDLQIVRRNWDVITKFYNFLHASATRDGSLLEEGRSSFFSGDWLTLESVDRLQEHKVIATAYFAQNTRMMAEMALALGDSENAAKWKALAKEIGMAFSKAYREQDGTIYTGTQTVYAMALGMDLLEDEEARRATAQKFLEKLARDGNHLRTGFLGTPWLLPALSRIDRNDMAMKILLNEDYPSWGFQIAMGASTMWERWDSIRKDGNFGPVEMNSFNHYAYGAVGDWMYQHLGGLQILEPGYKKVRIAPLVGYGGLTESNTTILTTYGMLACSWTMKDSEFAFSVTIPVNTEAELVLPANKIDMVTEGDVPLAASKGIHIMNIKDGKLILAFGSGKYEFRIKK